MTQICGSQPQWFKNQGKKCKIKRIKVKKQNNNPNRNLYNSLNLNNKGKQVLINMIKNFSKTLIQILDHQNMLKIDIITTL